MQILVQMPSVVYELSSSPDLSARRCSTLTLTFENGISIMCFIKLGIGLHF